MRDEAGLLAGWGVGTATFPALMFTAQARAVIWNDGTGVIEIGAHDMGQGRFDRPRPNRGGAANVELSDYCRRNRRTYAHDRHFRRFRD
jgi:hypothetical protein